MMICVTVSFSQVTLTIFATTVPSNALYEDINLELSKPLQMLALPLVDKREV